MPPSTPPLSAIAYMSSAIALPSEPELEVSAVPASTLLALERANWRKLALALRGEQNPSPGLELLLQFWRSVPGGGRLALP